MSVPFEFPEFTQDHYPSAEQFDEQWTNQSVGYDDPEANMSEITLSLSIETAELRENLVCKINARATIVQLLNYVHDRVGTNAQLFVVGDYPDDYTLEQAGIVHGSEVVIKTDDVSRLEDPDYIEDAIAAKNLPCQCRDGAVVDYDKQPRSELQWGGMRGIKTQELRLEMNSWELLVDVSDVGTDQLGDDAKGAGEDLRRAVSEKLKKSSHPEAWRIKTILRWLEQIAECRDIEKVGADRQSTFPGYKHNNKDKREMWKHTAEQLRRTGSPVSLDPDAPLREDPRLETDDDRNDRELMTSIWYYMREGSSSKAKRMCETKGQKWRAASLSGSAYGNPHRELWKKMCFKLSEKAGVDKHEKAVYALLGGNLESLVKSGESHKTWNCSQV